MNHSTEVALLNRTLELLLPIDSWMTRMLAEYAANIARLNFEWRFVTTVLFVEYASLGVSDFIRAYGSTVVVKQEPLVWLGRARVNQFILYGKSLQEIELLLKFLSKSKVDNTGRFLVVCTDPDCDEAALMRLCWNLRIVNVVFARTTSDTGEHASFTYFPFSGSRCEDRRPIQINTEPCENDICFRNLYPEKLGNLHLCPIVASTFIQTPFMFINNASEPSGGDGDLLRLLVNLLNATLTVVTPSDGKGWGILESNNWTGCFGDVQNDRANFSITSAAITYLRYSHFQISLPYNSMDIVWVTSPPLSKPGWVKLVYPYKMQVRVVLFATFVLVAILNSLTNTRMWNKIKVYTKIESFKTNLLFFSWTIFMGMPVNLPPIKPVLSAIFLLWIWFSFWIRLAYQTALISSLKVNMLEDSYKTFEEAALDFQIPFGGVGSLKEYYADDLWVQEGWIDVDSSKILETLYELSESKIEYLIAMNKETAFDFLKRNSGTRRLQIIPAKIVNSPAVIYFKRFSPLALPMSRLLSVVMEGGLSQRLYANYVPGGNVLKSLAAEAGAAASQDNPQPLRLVHFTSCWVLLVIDNKNLNHNTNNSTKILTGDGAECFEEVIIKIGVHIRFFLSINSSFIWMLFKTMKLCMLISLLMLKLYISSAVLKLSIDGTQNLVIYKILDTVIEEVQQHFDPQRETMVLSKGVNVFVVNEFLRRFNGSVVLSIQAFEPLPKQIIIFIGTVADFFQLLTELKPNLKGKDLVDTTARFMIAIALDSGDISRVSEAMWRLYATDVVIVTATAGGRVELYTYYPYSRGAGCGDSSPVLIAFSDEKGRMNHTSDESLYANKMNSFHGCPLFISITKLYHPLGTDTIPVEMVKMEIVRLLQRVLDFTPVFAVAEYAAVESDGANNSSGSLGDLLHGRANLSLSSAVPSAELARALDLSSPYYYLDVCWVGPPVAVAPAWGRLLAPLSRGAWAGLLATLSLVFGFLAGMRVPRVRRSCRKYFRRIETVEGAAFRAWGAMLGQPVRIEPRKFRDFYLVSMWVWFAFTVRSAYQSSLIGALKSEVPAGDFATLEEAVAAGYQYGGKRGAAVHFDREPDVMARYVEVPDEEFDELFERMGSGRARFVTPVSLEYVWAACAGRALRSCVHVLPEPIVTLPLVVFARRRSPLTRALDAWLTRMRESGLLLSAAAPGPSSPAAAAAPAAALPAQPEPLTLQQVAGCFFCLIFGALCSIFVFIAELITFRHYNGFVNG